MSNEQQCNELARILWSRQAGPWQDLRRRRTKQVELQEKGGGGNCCAPMSKLSLGAMTAVSNVSSAQYTGSVPSASFAPASTGAAALSRANYVGLWGVRGGPSPVIQTSTPRIFRGFKVVQFLFAWLGAAPVAGGGSAGFCLGMLARKGDWPRRRATASLGGAGAGKIGRGRRRLLGRQLLG